MPPEGRATGGASPAFAITEELDNDGDDNGGGGNGRGAATGGGGPNAESALSPDGGNDGVTPGNLLLMALLLSALLYGLLRKPKRSRRAAAGQT